ncbi:NAD-binding protein [Halarcobacter sp.]|uniref:NAD-binding protein n=1 Tax=Halarcobacter sp. TaxID=2321133 RepID=UPI002AA7E1B6|nr:NAD-binding protein [Halarcobacter sp.]
MKNSIVNGFYKLDSSTKYTSFKEFTRNILENNHYKYKKYFDFCMIFLVLSTIGILIYEVNHTKVDVLNTYEYFAIVIFLFEWIGRLWVYSDVRKRVILDYEESLFLAKKYKLSKSLKKAFKEKLEFIFSPMSIIDLLAILPAYRPLRVLRIFLLFRLFKIIRYTNSLKEFLNIFVERKFELYTLAILSGIVIFFGSTIMFVYEGPEGVNDQVNHFFDAVYWSLITISTVGYGDIVPITPEGKFVTLILVINGFLVIAFSTSIVTTALAQRMETIKKNRVENEVNKLDEFVIICGYDIMAKNLVRELTKHKKKVLIVDDDENNIAFAQNDNLLAILDDPTNMDFLKKIGVGEGASTIITLSEDDATNLSIVLGARALDNNIKIITLVNDQEVENKLKLAGADFTINSNEISAYVAGEYIGQPVAFEAVDGILLNDDISAEVDEIEIVNEMNIIDKNINLINFENYNLTLIGIINNSNKYEFIFNPVNVNYTLKQKDILIVIGFKESLKELRSDLLTKNF